MGERKLIENLMQKLKPTDLKWIYLFDSKNVILYSLAESDPDELCMIKRHITGKSCWFLEESFDEIFAKKQLLEIIDPEKARQFPIQPVSQNSVLVNLLEAYRSDS